MFRVVDCASVGIQIADPSRDTPGELWLEMEDATAEVQEALNAGTHRRSALINSPVRLAKMESSLSSYRGVFAPEHNREWAHYHGDSVRLVRQAIHVLDMQACKHCAEIQDSSAGEGITKEEGAEPIWRVVLQRSKAQRIVGLGEVHPHSQIVVPPLC